MAPCSLVGELSNFRRNILPPLQRCKSTFTFKVTFLRNVGIYLLEHMVSKCRREQYKSSRPRRFQILKFTTVVISINAVVSRTERSCIEAPLTAEEASCRPAAPNGISTALFKLSAATLQSHEDKGQERRDICLLASP
jgi:hypothetical protein